MFPRVCGFWTDNKMSSSMALWSSDAPPCQETSGYSPGVRKKDMKGKQKRSKPVMSPG